MLARYVKQEDIGFIPPPKEDEINNILSRHIELLDKIKEKINIVVAAIDGLRRERDTRMLLDAIFVCC